MQHATSSYISCITHQCDILDTVPTACYIILHHVHPMHPMHHTSCYDILDTLPTICCIILYHVHPMHHTLSYNILEALPTTCYATSSYIMCIPCITQNPITFLTHYLQHFTSSYIIWHSWHIPYNMLHCYIILHHLHPMHHTFSYNILDTLPTTFYIILHHMLCMHHNSSCDKSKCTWCRMM